MLTYSKVLVLFRPRLLSAAVAALAIALATIMLAAPSDARSERAGATAPRPQVGQCRTTTFDQGGYFTDSNHPVKCSRLHRMRTFAVVDVPRGFNYLQVTNEKLYAVAYSLCSARFKDAVGGGPARRDQTAYTWFFFGPSHAARKAGARWLRCDLALLANNSLARLPNRTFPVLAGRPVTDAVRRCLANADNEYWTTCSRQHVARANQVFRLSGSYPSPAAAKAAAATRCPGKRFSRPLRYDWVRGDHVIVCYAVTTS